MQNMFKDCTLLEVLELPNIQTQSSLSFAGLFSGCENLLSLDLTSFDTSLVTEFSDLFLNCHKLRSITFPNGERWDTSEGKLMRSMFEGCWDLTSLSLTIFKTQEVTLMNNMFKDCSKLEKLELNFNTKNVNKMDEMFSNVTSLRNLDLSSFDTSNVDSAKDIWKGITELTLIIDEDKNGNILADKPEGIVIVKPDETNY